MRNYKFISLASSLNTKFDDIDEIVFSKNKLRNKKKLIINFRVEKANK
jgi:hypothetical protein